MKSFFLLLSAIISVFYGFTQGLSLNEIKGETTSRVNIIVPIDQNNPNDCYTSINSIKKSDRFVIYPNPNQGEFDIEISDMSYSGEVTVSIWSLDSKLVYNKLINNNSKKVHLSLKMLEKGIYVIKVKLGNIESVKRMSVL